MTLQAGNQIKKQHVGSFISFLDEHSSASLLMPLIIAVQPFGSPLYFDHCMEITKDNSIQSSEESIKQSYNFRLCPKVDGSNS